MGMLYIPTAWVSILLCPFAQVFLGPQRRTGRGQIPRFSFVVNRITIKPVRFWVFGGRRFRVMTNDELLSKTISYLRFPLTVGVVFIHFNLAKNGFSMHGIKYGLDNPDWYDHFIKFFSDVLPRIGVPLFFLISGFLFFYRKDFDGNVYKQKLRSRAKTLLVPFVLWNIIAILIKASHSLPFLASIFPNANKTEFIFTPIRLFNTFFANFKNEGIFVTPITDELEEISQFPYPVDGPLWYVRELMVMILLSPIIFWLIRRMGKWFVIVLGVVYFFYQALFMPDGGWSVLLSRAAFFFTWGAYYSINKLNFVEIMRRYSFMPLVYVPIAIVDTLTKGAVYNIYIHEAGILVGIVSAVVIASYLLASGKSKVNETLANGSFFVFALHILIMNDIGKVIFSVLHLPDNTYSMLALYIIVPTITIIICLTLYVILKRYVPVVCNLLTGGR